ncbi:XRE family transcriptional regulator [Chitinophaga barathri]|uniref:ImmA/IrrE family metallo-endopeptidase n=1 Tax=Chitinophaga barathri TaxID=1647451 RepID=A0A3N4M7Z8_9BACT|nr:XRE family transcriptional regulator [Chitinophaga barathri]RPD39448.1 ImmA/IrrE family metallo-endopeptidase [Chitinophaga barathri]
MFNRKMITLAREARGLSQEQLSNMLHGITQATLSNFETGRLDLNEDSVSKIAHALNFPITLFKHEAQFNRISKFYYRKRSSFPAKEIVPLEAKIDIIRRAYSEFLRSIEFEFKELPKIPVSGKNNPEVIAKYIRLFLGLNEGPIDNPVSIIEKIGIPVLFLDVKSDKFSGMVVETDKNKPLIVINKNMPNDHKKFTLAHELGHLVMHNAFTEDPEFFERLEDRETVEKEADRFAGAFLIPAEQARYTFRPLTYSRLSDLKLHWKVSKQAIIYRAKDLGIIDDVKFKTLFIELSRFGERKKEKLEIQIDEPKLLKMIINAFEKHLGYTTKSLAENIAGLNESEFLDWFDIHRPGLKVVAKS